MPACALSATSFLSALQALSLYPYLRPLAVLLAWDAVGPTPGKQKEVLWNLWEGRGEGAESLRVSATLQIRQSPLLLFFRHSCAGCPPLTLPSDTVTQALFLRLPSFGNPRKQTQAPREHFLVCMHRNLAGPVAEASPRGRPGRCPWEGEPDAPFHACF